MRYKLKLTPADGTANGWFIHYFRWISPDAPAPDMHLVQGWDEDDGSFTAAIDVPAGEYGLACHLALSGRSIEVTLDPEPRIVWPANGSWPFEVKVPSTASQTLKTIYFKVLDQ
jgi:hypothetical protein